MGKQKKLLTLFEDKYDIMPYNGGYLIYDKEKESAISNQVYLGQFYLSNSEKQYVFQNNYYNTPQELLQAIEKYNKTLPFNQEFFSPVWKANYRIHLCCSEYLRKLGFVKNYSQSDFLLLDQHREVLCRIEVKTIEKTTTGVIIRKIESSEEEKHLNKTVQSPFVDLDSAIGAINSILVNYTSVIIGQFSRILSNMSKQRSNLILNRTYDMKKHSETIEDNKQMTIKLLEEELKRLKEG